MSKKRKKNSDYHYAERRDNAERIQAQKAERKKTTRKEKKYSNTWLGIRLSTTVADLLQIL